MKRKVFSFLMCLAFVFTLFSALSTPAMAASYVWAVGQKVWEVVDVQDFSHASSATDLPQGLTLGQNDGCYIIYGTPTTPGTYSVTVWYHCYVDPSNGEYVTYATKDEHTITILPAKGGFSGHVYRTAEPTAAPTAKPTAAPTAKPTAAPTAKPTAAPTPKPDSAPVITKHPTKETVTEGGSAKFIAYATDYARCTWLFLSPNGKQEVRFDAVGDRFPGLKISGGNSTTLSLKRIPMEMNGWKAVCLFSSDTNLQTYTSDQAVITVNPAAPASVSESTPEPTIEPTPEPAVAPTAGPAVAPTAESAVALTAEPAVAPTAEPAVVPTAEPAVVPTAESAVVPTAEPAGTPGIEPVNGGRLRPAFILALILLLLIGGAVAFILRRKHMGGPSAKHSGTGNNAVKRNTWVCSNCGANNIGKFCQECGDPIDPTDQF